MLTDELILLKSWATSGSIINLEVTGGDLCPLGQECERIRNAWTDAAFSTATNECLERYFRHQLLELTEVCRKIDDTEHCLSAGALSLIDHLRLYHHSYLDTTLTAPEIYRARFAAEISEKKSEIAERLNTYSINPQLKVCLLDFLEEIYTACSYQFLDYFRHWVTTLSAIHLKEDSLHQALESLNFNDLAYFHYRQKAMAGHDAPLTEKIGHLHTEKSRLIAITLTGDLACNPRWPSLSAMLCSWMAEEIAFLSDKARLVSQAEKYPLNISVAHLACFLKLFSGGELTGNRNLTQLFGFVTAHFSSKRQGNISAGSLSKEYYGTTQVTAAKVQGMLQHMISEINRLYFP